MGWFNRKPPIRDEQVSRLVTALHNERDASVVGKVLERAWAMRQAVQRNATQDEVSEAHRRLEADKAAEAARLQGWAERFVRGKGIDEALREAERQESAFATKAEHREGDALIDAVNKAREQCQEGRRCGDSDCDECRAARRAAESQAARPGSLADRPRNSVPSTGAASNTHITGGTSMGIEEIKQAIAGVQERVSTVSAQLSGVRTELGEATSLLAQATNGSSDADVSDALGTLRGLDEQLQAVAGQALQAGESALNYAGRL